ncbi:hypothetical protein Tco_1374963 [Tanacetum coccineum]
MDDEPMWVGDHVVTPTPGSVITIPDTANEFAIKGICDMFKYRDTENEAVCLMMFPLSLTGEAKTWLDELNKGTITTWDEIYGGIFLYKTPNQAYQLLKDKVLLKLDWAKNQKSKSSLKKILAFADEGPSCNTPILTI